MTPAGTRYDEARRHWSFAVVSATPRHVTAGWSRCRSRSMATASARNLVTFHSRRWAQPRRQRSGAGPDVTAAGILNDICSLGPR